MFGGDAMNYEEMLVHVVTAKLRSGKYGTAKEIVSEAVKIVNEICKAGEEWENREE